MTRDKILADLKSGDMVKAYMAAKQGAELIEDSITLTRLKEIRAKGLPDNKEELSMVYDYIIAVIDIARQMYHNSSILIGKRMLHEQDYDHREPDKGPKA